MLQRFSTFCALMITCTAASIAAPPEDSLFSNLQPGTRFSLIDPMEVNSFLPVSGSGMDKPDTQGLPKGVAPKCGPTGIMFYGTGNKGYAKGTFKPDYPGISEITAMGAWIYLPENSNIKRIGFQIIDEQREGLFYLVPADWIGWKWVEVSMNSDKFEEAWPQKHNKKVDLPVRDASLVWFTHKKGKFSFGLDELCALTKSNPDKTYPEVRLIGNDNLPINSEYNGLLLLENPSDKDCNITVDLVFQQDSTNDNTPVPHPIYGKNISAEARSRTIVNGKKVADNTVVDGKTYTGYSSGWKKPVKSATQYIEFDNIRNITAIQWKGRDANNVRKVNISASTNGKDFTPVPGLQNLDFHKKWGLRELKLPAPFKAKVIKFDYIGKGDHRLAMPAEYYIYDGNTDEKMTIPNLGEKLAKKKLNITLPAGKYKLLPVSLPHKLTTGNYLLSAWISSGKYKKLINKHIFIEPKWLDDVSQSRFGLNGARPALTKLNRKLGIGWIRFENFKWLFTSSKPHQYSFTGKVKPWGLDFDRYMKTYRDAGLQVLPMMFLTPKWATIDKPEKFRGKYPLLPPKDPADYGEFAFQSVARYGSKTHPADKLKTDDKKSALNMINYFELGNEPNLNPRVGSKWPTWGAWAGTMSEFWEMFRYGAEAVKKADPNAKIVSPGWAGTDPADLDQMRTYTYKDGKHPIDFIDVISVHYYSGRVPPEIAMGDANNSKDNGVKFEKLLKRLKNWRDRHRPNAQIWMTETGYDTGGPIGTSEFTQAARLPRIVMLCLANGVDKIFVYRESGSTPTRHAAAGVLRNDFSVRPSWYTYATMIRQMDKIKAGVKLPYKDQNVRLQTWERNGEPVLTAWTITGTAKLNLELGPAIVTDAFGYQKKVNSTRELTLDEYPKYISGFKATSNFKQLCAHAEKQEKQREAQDKAAAKREVYLFSFGDSSTTLSEYIGRMRIYSTVKQDTLYTPKTGYGFVGKPAYKKAVKNWKRDQRCKTGLECVKDNIFKIDLKNGKYKVICEVDPGWKKVADLELKGVKNAPVKLHYTKNKTLDTVQVEVTNGFMTISCQDKFIIYWMKIEKLSD